MAGCGHSCHTWGRVCLGGRGAHLSCMCICVYVYVRVSRWLLGWNQARPKERPRPVGLGAARAGTARGNPPAGAMPRSAPGAPRAANREPRQSRPGPAARIGARRAPARPERGAALRSRRGARPARAGELVHQRRKTHPKMPHILSALAEARDCARLAALLPWDTPAWPGTGPTLDAVTGPVTDYPA